MAFIDNGTTVTCACGWTFTEARPPGWGDVWFEIHANRHADDTGREVTITWVRTATVNNEPDPEDEENGPEEDGPEDTA